MTKLYESYLQFRTGQGYGSHSRKKTSTSFQENFGFRGLGQRNRAPREGENNAAICETNDIVKFYSRFHQNPAQEMTMQLESTKEVGAPTRPTSPTFSITASSGPFCRFCLSRTFQDRRIISISGFMEPRYGKPNHELSHPEMEI